MLPFWFDTTLASSWSIYYCIILFLETCFLTAYFILAARVIGLSTVLPFWLTQHWPQVGRFCFNLPVYPSHFCPSLTVSFHCWGFGKEPSCTMDNDEDKTIPYLRAMWFSDTVCAIREGYAQCCLIRAICWFSSGPSTVLPFLVDTTLASSWSIYYCIIWFLENCFLTAYLYSQLVCSG